MAETNRYGFPHRQSQIEGVAVQVLEELYMALAGEAPRVVRAYRDSDALVLLLRFDAGILRNRREYELEPLIDISFMAMLEMVAEIVAERTGRPMAQGNLSVCADSGLAAFGFTLPDERLETVTRPLMYRHVWSDSFDGGLRLAG
jgi:hypothetical protein